MIRFVSYVAELGDPLGSEPVPEEHDVVLAGIGVREPRARFDRLLVGAFATALREVLQQKHRRQIDAAVERQIAVEERRLKSPQRGAVDHHERFQIVTEGLPLAQPPLHQLVGGGGIAALELQVFEAGVGNHHSEDYRLQRFELPLPADVFKVESEDVVAALQDFARKEFADRPCLRPGDHREAVDLGREGIPDRRLERRHPGGSGVLLDIERDAVLERRQLGDAGGGAPGDRGLQRRGDDELAGLLAVDLLEPQDVVVIVDIQVRPRLLEFVEDVERHRLELGVVGVDRPADRGLGADGARQLVEGREPGAALSRKGIRRVGGGCVVVRRHRRQGDAVVGVAIQLAAEAAERLGEEVLLRGAARTRIRQLLHELADGAVKSGHERREPLAGDRTVVALHVLEAVLEGAYTGDRVVHVGALGFAQRNADAVDRHAVVPDVLERGDVRVGLPGERVLDALALVVREGAEDGRKLFGEDPADALAQVRPAVDAAHDRLDYATEPALGEVPELQRLSVGPPSARLREQIVDDIREIGNRLGHGTVPGLSDRRPVDGLG